MKVLHYIDVTEPGGALNQVVMLLNEMQRKITEDAGKSGENLQLYMLTDNHTRVHQVMQKELHPAIGRECIDVSKPKDFKHIGLLRKFFVSLSPDIIHLHLNHSGACRYAFLANKLSIPIVTTEHDPFPLSSLKTIIKNYTLRHTNHTIVISNQNREFMRKHYNISEDRVITIHNGIEIEKYRATPPQNHKEPIIGSVMELHERKGPDILVKAFKKIREAVPEAKLFIAGDGPMKAEITQLIKDLSLQNSVRLFGWVNDIPKFLSEIDIFVLTSRREAFGLAALEAQAAKKPVIASKTGGLMEIIDHEQTGILCPPGNSDEFAETSIHLLNNPVQCQSFVKNAYEKLIQSFSSKHVAKKTITLYKEILTTT